MPSKPHPETPTSRRLAPWLIAGGSIAAGLVLLAGAAWFLAPRWFPDQVLANSPWVGPTMRAAVGIEIRRHGGGSGPPPLQTWVGVSGERCAALVPYLRGEDPNAKRIALVALAGLNGLGRPPAVDAARCELLHDPSPTTQLLAAIELSDPASIPALEAMGTDPDPQVAKAVAETLVRLKAEPAAR
jgi:hypothetical protein